MMKRILLLVVVSLAFSGAAQAQRYLAGQRGVQFTAGAVDGFSPRNGFHAGAALSSYTSAGNRWVFGGEYLEKQFDYRTTTIPVAQFTLEAGHYFMLMSDPSKTLFLSLGGTALAGYQSVNRGETLLFDGSTIRSQDTFLYGGAITLELETYLTDRLVLLINARERVMFGSSVGKFATQFGVGLKFMLN